MQRGYIKTWRKAIDSGWLRNHRLWVFWSWCLLKASYKEYDLVVGCQKVHLMPGDFVFGRRVAASELNMSEREIRTAVDSLKTSQNIAIKTTNKFSIISVLNWDTYQQTENINDQQNDQLLTNKRPTTDHKQEVKNKRIKEYSEDFLSFWSAYPKKTGSKKAAFDNWKKLNGSMPEIEVILSAITKQKEWRENSNGEFRPEWKDPERWIKGKMWEVELAQPEKKASW
jgi:hypothetical protein